MNIVIFVVSTLVTLALSLALVKLCGADLRAKPEPVNHVRDVYLLLRNERHGYLYKRSECPHDLSCQYHHLREFFQKNDYYNVKYEKLLQLGSSFTVDELNKQRNELGKQYVPSPAYTDQNNLELLDKLWEFYKAREWLMDRASDIEEHTIHVKYV